MNLKRSSFGLFIGVVIFLGIVKSGCNQESFPQGKRLFEYHCSNCHMTDGSGLEGLFPSIEGSAYLDQLSAEMPCLIRQGRPGSVLPTLAMPGFSNLSETEINNLLNYMQVTWGKGEIISPTRLKKDLSNCQ